MGGKSEREQDHEDALEKALAKPGIADALQLWEITQAARDAAAKARPRQRQRATRRGTGVNDLYANLG